MLMSEEKARKYLVKNIRYIMFKTGIERQKDFAEKMGIVPAALVKILKEEQTPTIYPFFSNFTKISGYSIEEILNTDIEEVEMAGTDGDNTVDDTQKQKFCGVYQLHYYDTSAFKGRENKDAKDALDFGLLVVYKDRGNNEYRCMAQFGLTRMEMLERYSNAIKHDKNGSMENVVNYLNSFRSSHMYRGIVEMSNGHIYLSINYGDRDHAYVILHRPDSTSNRYIGGLGTMVSVSKGRNASPCMQVLGLSRFNLDVSEEEIARRLLLGFPSIKPGDKCERLFKLIQQVFQQPQHDSSIVGISNFEFNLTDSHKAYIIRGEITRLITDIVENNLFRTVKISYVDDDEWYHFVKKFDPKKR